MTERKTRQTVEALRRRLEDAQNASRLVATYVDESARTSVTVGFVQSVGDEAVVIGLINEWGRLDGSIVQRLCQISRLETDSEYLRSREYLHRTEDSIFDESVAHEYATTLRTITDVLQRAKEDGAAVVVEDYRGVVYEGYVIEVGSDWFQIDHLLDHGQPESSFVISIDDLVRAEIGSPRTQRMDRLYRRWVHSHHER